MFIVWDKTTDFVEALASSYYRQQADLLVFIRSCRHRNERSDVYWHGLALANSTLVAKYFCFEVYEIKLMSSIPHPLILLIVLFCSFHAAKANFEDTRCRCVCPSSKHFSENSTVDDNHRRYYTKTNINPNVCNPQNVVKEDVIGIVDPSHLDAFLANCDCKYESRNTVMLKVVVIFVICVVVVLVTYMLFLMCLDPMFRRQKQSIPYRHHNDEVEENIFARSSQSSSGGDGCSPPVNMRPRPNNSVLERVEAEQNKWARKVEEQRRKIFTDHTMLN
uniref:TMEM9 protein n=1 Tax=Steinernema glaseri TaxID=37863 RepID=A0A1I7ZH07_9BILA